MVNWFTLVINTALLLNLVLQHNQILRLHRHNNDLDPPLLQKCFKAYFYTCFLFALTSIDLHHFKFPLMNPEESAITTENMVCSLVFMVVSVVFIVSIHITFPFTDTPDADGITYYTEDLERQLLLSSDTMKSSSHPVVTVSSSPMVTRSTQLKHWQQSEQLALKSKDISPIQSFGAGIVTREMVEQSPISQHSARSQDQNRGRKFSAVKTPILATLLNADTALAAATVSSSTQNNNTALTALPIIISFFYLASQVMYSTSIIKTNVYTPYKYFVLSGAWNVLLGVIIATTTLLDSHTLTISLVQFSNANVALNLTFATGLVVYGLCSLAVHYARLRLRSKSNYASANNTFNTVQVYNSISSPSLQSVY